MKRTLSAALCALFFLSATPSLRAQQGPSTYADGDSLAALVKMNYVYTLEQALVQSRKSKKPIFFNAFADFARPCHGMNGQVFSDDAFCRWMDKNFVCLFIDVTQRENRYIAERYGITSFAHYLVLDSQGEVIHRIVGGAPLPTFQEKVSAALSPKTSLRGTTAAYLGGDRSKKLLGAYVTALYDAGEDSLYKLVLPQYFDQLTPADYVKKENWFIVKQRASQGLDSEMCRFMVDNRAKFEKSVGAEEVNTLLNQMYVSKLYTMMIDTEPFNPSALTDVFVAMQRDGLPDTLSAYTFYAIVRAYRPHHYEEVLRLLPQIDDIQLRTMVEISLKFEEPTEQERRALIDYYREREQAYKAVRSSYGRAYQDIADQLERPAAAAEGIQFSTGSLDELLAQARKEGKMVFVDCYTTWCGPCKMLARQTFPNAEVGAYFNPRFVSVQIDMEKGEGIELAKRWGVSAYPTMVILDADGQVKGTVVGFQSPAGLIAEVKKVLGE
ncbi:MAG: thioredoxin family protein [Bacteroidaceae bacterium]|nr:thioredoxin family protein [Bacteroidaceae bacterium]